MPGYNKSVLIIAGLAVFLIVSALVGSRLIEKRVVPQLDGKARVAPDKIRDGTGKEVAVTKKEYDVVSWDPSSGTLEIKDGGKTRKVSIVFPDTMVLLASSNIDGRSGMMAPVRSKDDPRWATLFCPGDKAALGLPKDGG